MTELLVERRGAIAELWLNRPEVLNPLSASLQEAIISALAELEGDSKAGVVILAGRGRAFSAGSDLDEIRMLRDAPRQAVLDSFARGERLMRAILGSRLSVILAAHGHCVGGGVSMALAADICIAAEGTQFFIPELALGMPYLWQSTPIMYATVGIGRARALIATGDKFSADTAAQMGLVHKVSPTDSLIADARALADRLAATCPRGSEAYIDASDSTMYCGFGNGICDVERRGG